jgi:hypothetical protein
MGRSKIHTPYTELACINEAFKAFGNGGVRTINNKQADLYRWWQTSCDDIYMLRDCLSGHFGTVEEVNRVLSDSGLALRVPTDSEPKHSMDPYPLATVGILDYGMKWVVAETDSVTNEDTKYAAVKLPGTIKIVRTLDGRIMTIGAVVVSNGDTVYMTKDTNCCTYEEDITNISILHEGPGYIVVPECSLYCAGDVEWLVNMVIDPAPPVWISWAGQESKIRVDVEGIIAKSATAILCLSGCIGSYEYMDPIYVIDQPYNIWITRAGLSKPIISTYVGTEDWRKL